MAIICGISGCATSLPVHEFADTANPSVEIQSFMHDMQKAQKDQINAMAPLSYQRAEERLTLAISAQQKGKSSKETLHEVAVGRAQLDYANKRAAVTRVNIGKVMSARQSAIIAGAFKHFPDNFNKIDARLLEVTSKIEKNDLSGVAGNSGKLQAEYLGIELDAIIQVNIGSARAVIAAAVEEGAKNYAKRSLAIAEKRTDETEAFIITHRHQSDEIKKRSEDTMLAANHLLKITRAVKVGKNIISEETALLQESQLINDPDENLDRRFEAVRSVFTKNEAEVYRKGNQVVIRLRALKFPANESALQTSNFLLLSKVTQALKEFQNPKVVVEGHSDSDGGPRLNHKLSLARSKIVSAYLVSTGAVNESSVLSVGRGYEMPLSSNKTVQGKAENRRVDIVITPQIVTQ